MDEMYRHWAERHRSDFGEQGISLEIIDHREEIKEKKLQDPVQVIYYYAKQNIGEVRIWRSGIMDAEILGDDGQTIYYQHHDDISGKNFDVLLKDFLQVLLA